MDDDGDWITARYLLSSILGRNPLVVDHVDEESFPVVEEPPRAAAPAPALLPPPRPPAAGVAGTVCAVCTEEIAAVDPAARLPCAHWYHHGCIAPWLGIRTTCPLCRAEVSLREDDGAGGEDGGSGRVKPRARAGSSAVRRDTSHEALAAGVLAGHGWAE